MTATDTTSSDEVNSAHLLSFIERLETLEEAKQSVTEDIKEVFLEAKGTGFDTKIIRRILKIRKQDRQELAEEQEILELYLDAIDKAEKKV